MIDDESNADVSVASTTDSRRQLIEHRRAQAIEPVLPLSGLDPDCDPAVIYRRERNRSGEWEIIRNCGGTSDRLDQRWQRPDEAYDWQGDLGVRMLARDLISDAVGLSPAERLPAPLQDRGLLVRFTIVVEHQLGDREWTITADNIRQWLRDQGFLD